MFATGAFRTELSLCSGSFLARLLDGSALLAADLRALRALRVLPRGLGMWTCTRVSPSNAVLAQRKKYR